MSNPFLILTRHPDRGYGLYAKKAFQPKEKILRYEGDIIPAAMAGKRSIQINQHFSFEHRSFGRMENYINHHCAPNCYLDFTDGIPVLTANSAISIGEELYYNYNTIELDLARDGLDFFCWCGSPNCIKKIQGFMYLTPQQEQPILPILSPYIKTIYEEYQENRY